METFTSLLLRVLPVSAGLMLALIFAGRIIDFLMDLLLGVMRSLIGSTLTGFFANAVTFIGVVHHELAHAVFAVLTGAKVTKIKFFTLTGGDALGYVTFIPRGNMFLQAVQLTMSSVAPVYAGAFTVCMMYRVIPFSGLSVWQKVLYLYIMISIVMHMRLSGADIRNALRGLPICILLLTAVLCAVYAVFGF